MALEAAPSVSITYGMRDIEGTETDMRVHTANPLGAGVASPAFIVYLQFAYATLLAAIQALSDSPITYFGASFSAIETAPPQFGGGEAESKGVFRFTDEQGRDSFAMAIPGIKASCLQANGRDIDLSNADVDAFVQLMVAGPVPAVNANSKRVLTVQGGNAYKQHRSSSGGSGRATG